jgi:hypothetical protein
VPQFVYERFSDNRVTVASRVLIGLKVEVRFALHFGKVFRGVEKPQPIYPYDVTDGTVQE